LFAGHWMPAGTAGADVPR
jgi:hypothetical protein